MPPLSETQLAGLKKAVVPIADDDIVRIFTALGLRRAGEAWKMSIDATYEAQALQFETPNERVRRAWRLEFSVRRKADGVSVGTTHRVDDLHVLQRRGAAVMSEMFASVDDLAPFQCPSCEAGLLGWDGGPGTRAIKPGMSCSACDWRGNTGKFPPLRDHR